MSNVNALIRNHPLAAFFALAFAISWLGVVAAVGPGSFPAPAGEVASQSPLVYVAMLAGPTVAGLLLTCLLTGRAGLRELLSRLLIWRLAPRWYAVALLATPLLALVTLLALLPLSPDYMPGLFSAADKGTVLLVGVVMGLVVGFFEELGWSGFAVPRLRQRLGVLPAGLIVGLAWGAWHFILAFWASGTPAGTYDPALFLPWVLYNVGFLPVYRVLMVWLYDHTESLLAAVLMHASLTGGLALTFMPQQIAGTPNLIWYLVLTVVLWVLVGVVAARSGGRLTRGQARRRIA